MLVSTNLRNWGTSSEPDTMVECALFAETAGIDTIWVNERLHTPAGMGWNADDGGRYLDCLMALTFIAARTQRIQLGTGVLNVPYRLPFQLVKQVATLQELSGNRFRFGIGTGWNETEFEVLGVPYKRRGKLTNEALRLFHAAFENDTVNANGVEFPVLPRPARPLVYVGGGSDAALQRTVRYGDGWIAAGKTPDEITAPKQRLFELAQAAGKPLPRIIAMKTLPLDDIGAAVAMALDFAAAGCDEFVHAGAYADRAAYKKRIETIAERIIPAVA
ncbi:MAG: putative F420-dependent oxidoreductase [Gammaproteobacteria bacterium]|jgi:probable F420-dependent oxidoreductase